jgi:hypothetical protein
MSAVTATREAKVRRSLEPSLSNTERFHLKKKKKKTIQCSRKYQEKFQDT